MYIWVKMLERVEAGIRRTEPEKKKNLVIDDQ
jgi:hypothetical protein